MVELPLHAGRARAVLDAANKLVDGKKATTVINTHHHFDSAGGLRVAAAEGAILFTSTLAKPYFEAVFAQPQKSAPDMPAASGRKPTFKAVETKTLLNDADRPVEIHELQGSIHARSLLVVWLPREQLLIEADAYAPGPPTPPTPPGAPDAAPPAVPDANHLNLVQNLDRLGLTPRLILPLQGRVVPAADLYALVGRKPPP